MTIKEVHKMAPSLKKASEMETPFKVPLGYFESVENEVLSQLSIENMGTTDQFQTPEGYFETLEDVVITKIKAEALTSEKTTNTIPENYFDTVEDNIIEKLQLEKKKTKIISLSNTKKIVAALAVAASLLLLITLGNQQEEVTFENLAFSEIEYAIESNLLDYDSETILELYPEVEASLADLEIEFTEDSSLETYLYDIDLSNILYE